MKTIALWQYSFNSHLIAQQVVDNTGIVPKVGMTFESEVKAYEMYNAYAGNAGFNIRKSQTRRRVDGSICQKYIVCSSQGHGETQTPKDSQGQVVMHVFSLVSVERGLGQCKRLYLITIIILLVQINHIS
jgi:hypothetical protein